MQSLIIKQDGKVYYIAEIPDFPNGLSTKVTYNNAINSAILVKNQETAMDIIREKYPIYLTETPMQFPYLKATIEKERLYNSVAIVDKDKEKSDEGEIWQYLIDEIQIWALSGLDRKDLHELVFELKQQYKITKR